MSNLIDDKKVVLGQLIRVTNFEKEIEPVKYCKYNDIYMSLQIEDEDGSQDSERCILMTIPTHTDMEQVTLSDVMTKNMVYGRLYKVVLAKNTCYLVKVKHYELDKDLILRISQSQLDIADQRAIKLPLTCTTKSWITDLLD